MSFKKVYADQGERCPIDADEQRTSTVEGGSACRSNRWGLMESSGCKVSVGNICPSICYIFFTVCEAENYKVGNNSYNILDQKDRIGFLKKTKILFL